MSDRDRLSAAYEKARSKLLAERTAAGHWIGELSASALSTATAVSALSVVRRNGWSDARFDDAIESGVQWLAAHQNDDGGFGDTDKSYSNIATTMLVSAAFHLADKADQHETLLSQAEAYIQSKAA